MGTRAIGEGGHQLRACRGRGVLKGEGTPIDRVGVVCRAMLVWEGVVAGKRMLVILVLGTGAGKEAGNDDVY